MIGTLIRIFWIHLRRDRIVWLLTFAVPVAFFSIFAIIFGGQGRSGTPTVRVAVVDEDNSDFSKKLVATLQKEKSLRVRTAADNSQTLFNRHDAEAQVRDGNVSAAIILPKGLGQSFPSFSGDRPTIELLADTSDQVAGQMLSGMLQGLVMTAAPEALMRGGMNELKKWGGGLTPLQQKVIDEAEQIFKKPAGKEGSDGGSAARLVNVKTIDVLGQTKVNPAIAFYAAATAVMFLLFSCAHGAGDSLIQEAENGTLDRLLSSNLTMTQLLAGKWLSFVMLGVMQVSVMFLWGWLVFKVELWSHLPGFLAMTIVTAAAAAAFGIMLGTLCKNRGQLSGVATTVILLMSAVGGSMFPRFMMSPTLQTVGLGTFNAWALDGYQKIFWRDAAVWECWPQLLVLACLTVAFLLASRWLARRWEAA